MPFRIRWAERARLDLLDIGDFIVIRNPPVASSFTAEIIGRTEVLRENLRIGRVVPEIGKDEIRELIHGNFSIVHRIAGAETHVLTVFEGHKLPWERRGLTPVHNMGG